MRVIQLALASLLLLCIPAQAMPLASRPSESGPASANWEPVAAQNGESLLHWSVPAGRRGRPERATQAVLLVPLPASDVQARLAGVLKREGFRLQETTAVLLDSQAGFGGRDLAEGDRWWGLYLSHHAEILPEVSDARLDPYWQKGLASGAILPADLEALNQRRVQQLQGSVLRVPAARAAAELRSPQTVWQASLEQRSRSGDQIRSETIRIYDVSRLLGASYTAVTLSREDSYRNPDYNPFKIELCMMGGCGKSARLSYRVVPYASLSRLLAALPADTLVADSPLYWAKPAAAAPLPDYREVPAASAAAVALVGEGFDWGNKNASPSALLVLPDGDLLLAETRRATAADSDSSHVSTVYRHRFSSSGVQSQQLWQIPKESSFRLALARDGRTLWFSARTRETLYMQRYDLQSGEVFSQAMPGDDADWFVWQLDSAQLPRFYDAVPDYQISQWRPEGEPQQLLAKTLRANFSGREGVGKLQPVYGHFTASEWAADDWGLTELDLATGMTMRSIPLPQDVRSSYWTASALAAPDAGWIARPWLRDVIEADGERRRGWGAYIVDTRLGKIRFSAALDQPGNVMPVMARSANGRLLALGQEWDGKFNNRFGLWDVAKGTSPVNLQLPAGIGNGYLRGLAFSPDGRFLYALSDRWLVRWALPAALQDKAQPGNWPAEGWKS
ncbi:hypothetical protein [Chitinilyticum piscinae]|uniref:Uncharacterized protein n=1 Tax=Chitinilyticum piscinae TaxID=2866724 RepID=A0A8J7FH36_9NEIS|nr:hypothetical protein [Chitinilyticum piscinae]MBE9609333.1 hypothetical protein [Chitinilyticum piscinae]